MYDSEHFVLDQIRQTLIADKACWLVTVIKTWGSSPRPPGSIMMIHNNGDTCGSISGGCVEDDLIEKIKENYFSDTECHFYHYGDGSNNKDNQNNTNLSLPCGGRLELVIEPIAATTSQQKHFSKLCDFLQQKVCVEREVDIETGQGRLNICQNVKTPFSNQLLFKQYFGPNFQLLLIGANQISQHLSQLAQQLAYKVSICEPRPDKLKTFKDQNPLLIDQIYFSSEMPDDFLAQQSNNNSINNCCVLTLSHDPRIDDMALMFALKHAYCYVGALGSKRSSDTRRLRLQQLELNTDEIKKLHAPIGLDILSKTPAEIAISIVADLIQHKNASLISKPFVVEETLVSNVS